MPFHKVQQGESLNGIALKYGFEWKKLWGLGENQTLKEKRGDPNVLFEGDEVFYPEKEKKNESGATEAKHTFKLPGVPFVLRIRLLNIDHKPLRDATWFCEIDGQRTAPAKTPANGLIVQKIPAKAGSVKLFVGGVEIPLKLRHLDPANTVRGIQQRLANLGYNTGAADGVLGPVTRKAVEQFQIDHAADGALQATGQPDAKTIKFLRQFHDNVTDDARNRLEESEPPPSTSLAGDDPDGDVVEVQEVDDDEQDLPDPDYTADRALAPDPGRPMPVACLQSMLATLGYDPGPIDGLDGPRTRAGVKAFQAGHQARHALAVDGIAGPLTRAALREVYQHG